MKHDTSDVRPWELARGGAGDLRLMAWGQGRCRAESFRRTAGQLMARMQGTREAPLGRTVIVWGTREVAQTPCRPPVANSVCHRGCAAGTPNARTGEMLARDQ